MKKPVLAGSKLLRKNTKEPELVRGALLGINEARNKASPNRRLHIEWKNLEGPSSIGNNEEIKNNSRLGRSIS